jgi:hypothetical protein
MAQVGFYAVRFSGGEVRITTKKVSSSLEAVDVVLGSRYAVPRPMIADVLHDFEDLQVKFLTTRVSELRRDKWRMEAIRNPEGWHTPAYPAERVAAAKKQLEAALKRNG